MRISYDIILNVKKALNDLKAVENHLKRGIPNSISNATRGFDRLGSKMSNIRSKFSGMAGLITGAFSLGAIKHSIDLFSKQEQAVASVENGIKSMGNVVGFTSKQLQKMASDMQNASTFGDEDILKDNMSILLTFGSVTGNVFKRSAQVVEDMAAKMGRGMSGFAIMVGKALNDPKTGLSALTRAGVVFTESQKTMIKNLVQAGKTKQAQMIMLAELEREFGGSSQAIAKTVSGRLIQLKNAWGDILEGIGGKIATFFLPKIKMLMNFYNSLSDSQKNMLSTGVALTAGIVAFGGALAILGTLLSPLLAIGSFFVTLASSINLVKVAQIGLNVVAGIYNGLMRANPMVLAITAGITAITLLVTYWDTIIKKVKDFFSWLQKGYSFVKKFLGFGGGDNTINAKSENNIQNMSKNLVSSNNTMSPVIKNNINVSTHDKNIGAVATTRSMFNDDETGKTFHSMQSLGVR